CSNCRELIRVVGLFDLNIQLDQISRLEARRQSQELLIGYQNVILGLKNQHSLVVLAQVVEQVSERRVHCARICESLKEICIGFHSQRKLHVLDVISALETRNIHHY